MRSRKPAPDGGFRDIVAAERDPVADTVERLVRGTNGHVVQDDPVVCPPRGRHVFENAGTGKRGLHQMRPSPAERNPSSAQRLTRRLSGRHATRNGIGVDDVNVPKPGGARQTGLAAPVRTGNYEEGRNGPGRGSGQADFRPGGLSTRSPSLVRAI